jgi:hypothetical protein
MIDSTGKEVVSDFAEAVVTQLAPQELPIFPAVCKAYFDDPIKSLQTLTSEDRVLGFGLDPSAALLTPVVLAVVSEAFQVLLQIAEKAVEDGLGGQIGEIVKRMLSKGGSSQHLVLTKGQIRSVHRKVLETAKKLKLSGDKSAVLADAVAAQFRSEQ